MNNIICGRKHTAKCNQAYKVNVTGIDGLNQLIFLPKFDSDSMW